MKISVVITTYNRPHGLIRAVNSVLAQTLAPSEIIIVNDGKDYPELQELISHSLIRLFQNEQSMGANFSRNKGAEVAGGQILMFLDDDDHWLPSKIENQVAIFEKEPSIGLVYSNRNVVNEDGVLVRRIRSQKSGCLYPDILFGNIIGTTSSGAVRKDVFHEVGGFDRQLDALQDYDLWIRICERYQVGLDTDFTVNYTVAADKSAQISGSGQKKKRAVEYILNKYNAQFRQLSFIDRQKVKSKYFFYISKSYKYQSRVALAKYSLLSFINFPNAQALALMLPDKLLNRIMR